HERLGRERQCCALPNVAIGIGVDDVLQRLAEFAECRHALLNSLAAEHLGTQREAALLLRVHDLSYCCGIPAASRTLVQRASSSAMNSPKASGVEPCTVTPALIRR